MARGGGKLTKAYTESAKAEYLYGTKEEVAQRLENNYPSTESHFSQIRPKGDLSPKGRSYDEHGTRGQNQQEHGPVDHQGNFNADYKRGNP